MAKTKKKYYKTYTPEERVAYYANLLKSKDISYDKCIYSRNWLEGYKDEHSDNNLIFAKRKYEKNKKYISDLKSTIQSVKHTNKYNLGAYINGLKARQNKK